MLVISCAIVWVVQIIARGALESLFGLTPQDVTSGWQVWQLGSYIFLHDRLNILHILFNMLGLWMFGSALEEVWGTRQFTRFFFICGIGAGLLMVVLSPGSTNTTIGASGSVYGVLLAFGMLFPDRIIYWLIFPIPAKYFVMLMGGIAFYSSVMASSRGFSDVAHVAHLGGMLFGFIYMKSRGLGRRRSGGGPTRRIPSLRAWYAQWQRNRLRKKFEVYYNERHQDNNRWRRWKN
jgi:membrane associated rhomboid family serine protease